MIPRALVAGITVSVLIAMWQRPDSTPHKIPSVTPYCVIDMHVAVKDKYGNWHFGWSEGYGPCNRQDRYHNA